MSNETPTPLTDAVYKDGDGYPHPMDGIDLARQLERQLAEAQKDTERLDWLLKEADPITKEIDTGPYMRGDSICFESRADIDKAMKASEQ